MRKTAFFAMIAFSLFAEGNSKADTASAAPVKHTVKMFAQAQYDSVLSLIQGNDSLKFGADIIGVGIDTLNNDIVVVAFDRNSNPAKFVFPDSSLKKKTAQPAISPKAARKLDQSGRTWFIIESALKSSVVYPLAYQWAFPHADGSVLTGLSLLTVGGSLYGAFAFTRNMELGYGKVGLMNYGSTFLGLYYPQLLATFLHNATSINDRYKRGFPTVHYEGITATDQIKAWFSMFGFPLGIYLGSKLRFVDRDDGGKVTLMGYFSQTAGYLFGFGLPLYFFDPTGDNPRDYLTASSFLTMSLLPAGFYAGCKIAGDRHISAGRGSLPYVSGILGGLSGLAIPTLFDLDYDKLSIIRTLATTTLVGYGGGTMLGLLYHPAVDYTYWQTVFIGASSGAGALMGVAFPLIGKVKDNHKPYVIMGVTGAWAGFFLGEWLSRSLFEKSDRDRGASGLSVSLPGLAALPMLLSKDRKSSASRVPALPMANLEWRF